MVHGHGALRVCFAGKHRKSDVIILSAVYELYCHIASRLDTVGLEVLCQHTGGNVHAKHYVDTLHTGVAPRIGCLRTCQGTYHGGVSSNGQNEGQVCEPHSPCPSCTSETCRRTHLERGCGFPVLHHVPYNIWYDEKQKQEIPGIIELHFFLYFI